MVPPRYKEDVMKTFLDDVSDGKLRSGEIELRYLLNTLDDANRPDLGLQMARQEEHPSYMRFLRRGETTLLEFWQDECRRKCHDMLGSILEWSHAAVLGLKPVGDGYKTFTVTPPYESEFGAVYGSVECPYGQIVIDLRRLKDKIILNISIPMSTTATAALPKDPKGFELKREGIKKDAIFDKSLELKHGRYTLEMRP